MFRICLIIILFDWLFLNSVFAQQNTSGDKSYALKSKSIQKNTDKLKVNASKLKSKKSGDGFTVSGKKQNKPASLDNDKVASHSVKRKSAWLTLRDVICKSCRESKTDCPDKTERKTSNYEGNVTPTNTLTSKANLVRSTNSVHFDVIQLEDIHLDIPAFKQFKNNMTDFTADGEHQFQLIIQKIGIYLGTNYAGKGVTLKIMGSASQIPTSFDPDKPNNNINPDGSSIIGKTSIEHNRKLAKARADELAKKIIAVFPSIQIITPKLEEIQLGATKWTKECQLELSKAFKKGDKAAMQKVYEPFQKDQWVKVESKEKTSKTIQPESIRMYMISTTPFLKYQLSNEEIPVKSVFIVSKKTYEMIEENKTFNSIEERDQYLETLGLKIFLEQKGTTNRWYLLNGLEEINAFKTTNYNEKVYKLYELGIVDNLDEEILEEKIIDDLAHNR
jgi:hypothetical protein